MQKWWRKREKEMMELREFGKFWLCESERNKERFFSVVGNFDGVILGALLCFWDWVSVDKKPFQLTILPFPIHHFLISLFIFYLFINFSFFRLFLISSFQQFQHINNLILEKISPTAFILNDFHMDVWYLISYKNHKLLDSSSATMFISK